MGHLNNHINVGYKKPENKILDPIEISHVGLIPTKEVANKLNPNL
jgi:hypothetical protein